MLSARVSTNVTNRRYLPKRIGFTAGQYTHTTPSPGYSQASLRTGYEYLIPHKTTDFFAVMAPQDGEVVSIDDYKITVKYKDGTVKAYEIGGKHGNIEGVTYKHNTVTPLKKGEKFKKDHPITYHQDFFEPDWLDPKRLIFKTTTMVNVAMSLSNAVYEDSSAISKKIMKKMTTSILHERQFIFTFDTEFSSMVKVGDVVDPNTTLFINMAEAGDAGNLSETSIQLLETLAQSAPRAQYKGTIDRIEVKYNGLMTEMSPSMRTLAARADKELRERTENTTRPATNNKVTGEYIAKGTKLEHNTMEIKIFIATDLDLAIGDKLVLANQAKTVVGDVFDYDIRGEVSGEEIDMKFSILGFMYRIIDSPFRQGTSNRLLYLFGKQVAEEYFK